MTLLISRHPHTLAIWHLPDWTPDLDLIVRRLRECCWRVEVNPVSVPSPAWCRAASEDEYREVRVVE